jgi:PKD repeat protein
VYGCEYPASQLTTVLAQPLPVADFSYTTDLLELSLTNLSSDATDYSWDFGDGESDTVTGPVHNYASANTYTVLLTAASACGYDTASRVIVVGSNEPPLVVNPLDDMSYPEDSAETIIDIAFLFSDPDGDTLTWSVSSDNISVVTASLSNELLTITTAGPGTATVTVSADDGHGGTASDVFVVQVNPLPPLTISYTRYDVSTAGGNDGRIELTVSGGKPPYTYSWSNGATTASLTYLRSGYYTVTVTDAFLHAISETIEIQGPSGQTCEFSISFTWEADTLITRNIRFTPSTTEYDLHWSFGDGYTSGVDAPLHSYDRSGLYLVCLVAYDEVTSCSYETCQMVQAGTLDCLADFDFYVDAGDSMLLHFSDNSSGAVSKWYWNFADGYVSVEQNTSHRFTRPGIYPVCLYTFDEATGCLSETCKEIRVGWVDMIAGFTYFVDPGALTVTFTNNSVGNISDYYWTYGDGNISAAKEGSYIYGEPGLYAVCLSISNSSTGQYSSICNNIQVGTPECDIHAGFSHFVDPASYTVNFTDLSSGTVHSRFWNFGDGASSASPNPVHQFSKPGFYLVGLSVRDTIAGCNDFHVELIQAGQAECKSLFGYSVDPVTLTVTMKDQSLGIISSYYWTFDDGYTSSESEPAHQFDAPGLHEISLTVRDETGTCMDYKSEMVQVGITGCSADFTVFIDSLTNTAWFNSRSVGQQIRYYWIFSDGTTSVEKNPVHTFPVPGYHAVSLNTFNEQSGCMDFNTQIILIGSQGIDCEAGFIYQADEATNTVTFADKSLGTGLNWYWNFGDEGFSILQNPEHDYATGGFYNVCLTVYSVTGIQNTTCKQVFAGPLATENCLARFIYTVNDADLEVDYTDESFGTPDDWKWEFGDEQKAVVQHPSHTFAEAGYYTTHMRIENLTNGCVSNAFALVSVDMEGGLKAGFGYTYDSTINTKAESYPVDYVGVSLGDASKYKWSFGDGTYDSTTTTPYHIYTAPGVYDVCLTVYDEVAGTENTTCDSVRVPLTTAVPPVYDFSKIQLLCYPNPADDKYFVLFDLPSGSYTEVELYTISGKRIRSVINERMITGRHELELDASSLANGLYIIRLRSDTKTATQILSVQH